jgi:hypothetical protein
MMRNLQKGLDTDIWLSLFSFHANRVSSSLDTLIVLFIIKEDARRLAPASTFDFCISNKLYGIVTGNERANWP